MSFITKIINLLFRPDTFFSQITKEKENLFLPVIIVLLGVISSILSSIITLAFSPHSSFDTAFASFIYFPMTTTIFNHFFIPLLFWAIASISIYTLSKIFSGTGSLKVTFQNTGYSVLPIALCSALVLLLTRITMIAIEQTGDTSFMAYTNHPLSLLSLFFLRAFPLFFVWSGYLCIYGTMHAHRVTMVKAIVAVAFGFLMVFLVNIIGQTPG
jgi:hypothetical protein